MLNKCQRLFCPTPKNKRIATLQAQDLLAFLSKFNQSQRNITLLRRRLSSTFSCIFDQCIISLQRKTGIIDQCIINDHIGLLQCIDSMKCQQSGIAGTSSDKPDMPCLHRRQVHFAPRNNASSRLFTLVHLINHNSI